MGNFGGDKLSKKIKYNSNGLPVHSPISVFDRKKFNIGTNYINYVGQMATVIDYKGAFDVIVRFNNTGSIKSVRMDHLKEGAFVDNEIDTSIIYGNKETGNLYRVIEKGPYQSLVDFKDYENCWISQEWMNYQYFAYWYINQYRDLNKNFIYNIDKDYKQIGNKIKYYSKDTCMLIPKELNMTIRCIYNDSDTPIGVFKSGKRYYVNTYGYEDKKQKSFEYAEEAFEYFKLFKLKQIRDYADYFYSNGALHKKDYDTICNFDFLPFGN